MPRSKSPSGPRPPLSRELVLEAIKKGASAKADLARVLGVKGDERVELRQILKALEEEGKLGRVGKRAFASSEQLSSGSVMEIVDRDTDGELLARNAQQGWPVRPHRARRAGRSDRQTRRAGAWHRRSLHFENRARTATDKSRASPSA